MFITLMDNSYFEEIFYYGEGGKICFSGFSIDMKLWSMTLQQGLVVDLNLYITVS